MAKKVLLSALGVVLIGIVAWRVIPLWKLNKAIRTTARPFESPWSTEQEWLVDQIVRDLAEMVAYASSGKAPAPEALRLTVRQSDGGDSLRVPVSVEVALTLPHGSVRKASEELAFEEHLFAPRQYERITRALLGGATAPASTPAAARPGAELLKTLLDLRAPVLLEQDRVLSGRLAADPLDADAHEQAALLLGAFALRDAAGSFTDTRPALCRMTAHLSMARALREGGEPGLTGRYAAATLLTLVGRERDALALLAQLEGAGGDAEAGRAWARALHLRNTGDWRLTREVEPLTLLERFEEARALSGSADNSVALDRLDRQPLEPVPDWGRILLQAHPDVETGNRFARPTLFMEMAEIAEARRALDPAGAEDEGSLIRALNQPAGRLVSLDAQGRTRVEVLGWPAWAFSGRRHLLQQLAAGEWVPRRMLGLEADAKAFREQARDRFQGLHLFPLVWLAGAPEEGDPAAKAAVADLARRHPEWMVAAHWTRLREARGDAAVPTHAPWFQPALPSGTLVDLTDRMPASFGLSGSPADRRARRELAPSNYDLAYAEGTRVSRAIEPTKAAFGALGDYHLGAMLQIAEVTWNDPVEGPRVLGKLCEIAPQQCKLTAERHFELGKLDEAAAAYQRLFDRARDRVFASNVCGWLVDYYHERGQAAKAMAVARAAAGTYSANGLKVLAHLTERLGRLQEAESLYQRVVERYDGKTGLLGFYYRQARLARRSAYEPRFRKLLAEVHAAGLAELDRAQLPSPPSNGVRIAAESARTAAHGIKLGHVIVALDGLRVLNEEDYEIVRSMNPSRRMVLLVWRGSSYDEIVANVPDRDLAGRIQDHRPEAAPSSASR